MKRFVIFLLGFYFFLTSCGDKKYEINYDGPTSIDIVLLEQFNLNISSREELSYVSDNELVVTVNSDGTILGKNVGEANVTISNSVNELTLRVVVSLFEEPTLDFGISPDEIISLYGYPRYNLGDSIFIYGSGNDWYSFTVWEMDFFFNQERYFEADLYVRKDFETRLNEYLDDNYFYQDIIYDTIDDQVNEYYIYLNESDAEDATVMVGKLYDAGPYNDICLFYIPYSYSGKDDFYRIFSRDRIKK